MTKQSKQKTVKDPIDYNEGVCIHGHMQPPECLACTLAERDALFDESVAYIGQIDALRAAFTTSSVKLLKAQQECERLEQLCLGLVTGIDALSSLLIEHHSSSDDGTESLVCNVCNSKTGRRLWKESDEQKQKWSALQNKKYGKAF